MNIKVFTLAALFALIAAPTAFAQGVAGRGSNDQVISRGCQAEVELVSDHVRRVRDLVDRIFECHAEYKMYDQDASPHTYPNYCREITSPLYRYEGDHTAATTAELLIEFEGPKKANPPEWRGVKNNIRGFRGEDGTHAQTSQCAPGYTGTLIP